MDSVPANANILEFIPNAYFNDSHRVTIENKNLSALSVYLELMKTTPKWVLLMMSLRNSIVSKLGLKHLGSLTDIPLDKSDDDFSIGDTVGIFTLISKSHQEIILEDQDKHLNVRISFYIEPVSEQTSVVHATTVVDVKNLLGKVYMLFVTPMHKIIVPCSLAKIAAK